MQMKDTLRGKPTDICGKEIKEIPLMTSLHMIYIKLYRTSVTKPFKVRLETVKGNIYDSIRAF